MKNLISCAIENIEETKVPEMFWSNESYKAAYGEDHIAFELFGGVHLFWLSLGILTWIFMPIIYRRMSEKGKKGVLITLVSIYLVWEVVTDIIYIVTGQWDNSLLPLHFCSINMFVCLFYLFKPSKLVAEHLYAICLPGAFFALLTPSWQIRPITNFFHIHSEILHILLVLFPILLIADGFRPNFRRLWKIGLIALGLCVPIYFINVALGTNFFFINGTDGVGTFEMLGSIFPDYRIGLGLLIVVVWLVLYTPWIIWEKCKKNKEKKAEAAIEE